METLFRVRFESIEAGQINCLLPKVQYACPEGCSRGTESRCVAEVRDSLTTQISKVLQLHIFGVHNQRRTLSATGDIVGNGYIGAAGEENLVATPGSLSPGRLAAEKMGQGTKHPVMHSGPASLSEWQQGERRG